MTEQVIETEAPKKAPKKRINKGTNYKAAQVELAARLTRANKTKDELEKKRVMKEVETMRALLEEEGSEKERIEFYRWARARKLLKVKEKYALNKYERDNAEFEAVMSQKPVGGIASYISIDDHVKFDRYYDREREEDVIVFYVDILKEPEDQIDRKLERKIALEQRIEPEDWAEAYTQVKRFELRESEFVKYFTILD